MDKTLIFICGATCVGKTSVAIEVAQHFKTQILSFDSRQFYKEMQIGTAVPNVEELSKVKHHFIQNKSIFESYSLGDYQREATEKIQELFQTHSTLVLVGGSGMYEKSLTKGLDPFPEVEVSIREELTLQLREQGLPTLCERLKILDPKSFESIALDNPQRVIRALEVCIGSGKPFSSFKTQNPIKENALDYNIIKIELIRETEELYGRINQRVEVMMEEGLLEEAKSLYPNRSLNALQTVGYKEIFDYLDGKISLDFAVEEIKKNTRRYAKRQRTWWRKDLEIHRFHPKEKQEILSFLEKQIL
ncbi:MAG: tRNA (adenosine(37)-N6)-dimethylallyltransferase MiaA [Flavobacteriaceae bacterium]|nr:MAG: tRNA (adenosine(37)-N6)-dimethylallyltransferase MiaA [Flavobacteriaceae bacterium]